jgi:hypothetical protein
MRRAQGALESILIFGALAIGIILIINEISASSVSLSKEKSRQSLESLADTISAVRVQGSTASRFVDIYIPPNVDPDNTGKTEVNTLVIALDDGSEIVVPVDGCLVGSLPSEPGIHTVVVRGGDCASLASNEFDVSPDYVIQKLQAGEEATLMITIETMEEKVVKLSSSGNVKEFIDLDTSLPGLQYSVNVNSTTDHEAKIIIPAGTPSGIYEGYIDAETVTNTDRILVRIEVYSTDLEVVTFSDSSRTAESDKFNVYEGLFYRVFLRNNGELTEGNLKVWLENPLGPVDDYPTITYTPTGIYDGYFDVGPAYVWAGAGYELGNYTLTVEDSDSGQTVVKQVEGTGASWLELHPAAINEWVKADTQLQTPITIGTDSPATVELSLTGDITGLLDLFSSTPEYDSTRSVSVGEVPTVLNDVYIKVPVDQIDGTWTGTITATVEEMEESIPVSITVYSDDIGWKIEFKDLGATVISYDGTGTQSFDKPILSLSSTGWKFTIADKCGENAGSSRGFCKPSDAWGWCDNEPAADWSTLSFDDSSWSSLDLPAISTDYNTNGNLLCADCTGFLRKHFTLTQEDVDTITSLTVKFKADEGLHCFVNGQDLGFETSCQTSWLPHLKTETTTSSAVLNSLQVGDNVLTCRLQERRKYSETQFKYFDISLEIHKEIPPATPTVEIKFDVLDQAETPITGLSIDHTLKKLQADPTLIGILDIVPDGDGYKIVFSPSELSDKAGPGSYLIQLDTSYMGTTFKRGITFNIDDVPHSDVQWYIDAANPTEVIVDPDNSLDLKIRLLAQDGSSLAGKEGDMDMTVENLDTGVDINCEIRDDGVFYHCEEGGAPLQLQPGQYLVIARIRQGEAKALYHTFTFNAVST